MSPADSWIYLTVTLVCVAVAFSFGFALGILCSDRLAEWLDRRRRDRCRREMARTRREGV